MLYGASLTLLLDCMEWLPLVSIIRVRLYCKFYLCWGFKISQILLITVYMVSASAMIKVCLWGPLRTTLCGTTWAGPLVFF